MIAVAADLAGVAAGQRRARERATVEIEAEEILLVAHGDQERGRRIGRAEVDHAGVRAPVNDAALGAAEDAAKFSVGTVVQDVIAAVTIEDVEFAVGQMERPRRAVLVFLLVLAGVGRPAPFVEELTVERGFGDAVRGEIGDEKDFAVALGDE